VRQPHSKAMRAVAANASLPLTVRRFLELAGREARGRIRPVLEEVGAAITLDGASTGLVTPAAIEGVPLYRPHEVQLGGQGFKATSEPIPPKWGAMVRRVHLKLQSTIGAVVVESDPAGAALTFDERPVGVTPVTVPGVRLDQPHRLDLALPGYELDQFVVVPEKDGTRFSRKLQPAAPKGAKR